MKIKLELTDSAAKELARICKKTGLNNSGVIKKAFNLFRVYLQARSEGTEWVILPNTAVDDLDGYDRIIVPGIKL